MEKFEKKFGKIVDGVYKGNLYLDNYSFPLPKGLTNVGGGLYLRNYSHPLPQGLMALGGYLDLDNYSFPLPQGLTTVGCYLDLRNYSFPLPKGLTTVGGGLYLGNYSHPLPQGLTTVGGDLYLGNYSFPLPQGLTALGGNLYLGNYSLPLPKGLTAYNYKGQIISWQDVKYIKADGIFTEVLSKKGNVYTVKKIGQEKVFYLATNGKFHAHGDTIEQAKEDLRFKVLSEKIKNDPITPDTVLTDKLYHIITGACTEGIRQWKQSNGIDVNKIKAKELYGILEKTNAYGFEKFKKLYTV